MKAALFDMDGLLLDTERVSGRAWQLAAKEFGCDLTWEVIYQFVGKKYPDAVDILREVFQLPLELAEAIGSRKQQIKDEIFMEEPLQTMPGAIELLAFLEERGIKMSLVTSTEKSRAEECLHQAGIFQYFSTKTFGNEVERGKPYPDIYLLAAERIGYRPMDCVAFEDSTAGVLAASAAGVRTFAVPDLAVLSTEARAAAYKVLNSLWEAQEEIILIIS